MKVICQGSELSDALAKVTRALPVKRTTPILDGVKLSAYGDTLTLFATDAELSIEKKINAEVLLEGEFVVPGKLFAEYAKKLEGENLELSVTDGKKLVIKYLDSVLNINGNSTDEYPVFRDVSKEKSFIILKKDLKDLINKIIFCVATEDTRPALKGCCLTVKDNTLEGVSSDGFRLALAKKTVKCNGMEESIVVPAKSLLELGKLMDDEEESISVYVEKNSIMVDLFHTKLVSRLIAETYMSYDKIIQVDVQTEVTLDKKLFENAMERVSIISRGAKNGNVNFDIKEDSITLGAESGDGVISEKVPASMKGKDLNAGFNSKYIVECLKTVDDEYLTFNFSSSTAPLIVRGSTPGWLHLILPLRVIN